MTFPIPRALLALLVALAAVPAPAQMDPAPRHPELRPTLDAFGGEAGLVALADDLVDRLVVDPRTAVFFETTDNDLVRKHLADQFCVILDGDCTYTGRDMATSHAGMGIRHSDFNVLVEILQDAMDARGIPFRAQNRLLAVLAPMHRDIIAPD